MSTNIHRDQALLAKAKADLIDAAIAIDPLAPMRRHPYVSLGIAAGIGAVLAIDRERLGTTVNLTRAIASFVRPIAVAASRYMAARASSAATDIQNEPAPTPVVM